MENEKHLTPMQAAATPVEKPQEAQTEQAAENPTEQAAEQPRPTREELQKIMKEKMEEVRRRTEEAQVAMSQGKGRLTLETPIKSGDEEITELIYDFTALNGMEYTDAMDSDPNATGNYRITYRQALSLFAKAAAKQTDRMDMQDIVSQIGVTDAVEGVQLATLFFNASTRAGRLRISKR